MTLDAVDRKLLNLVQTEFPLTREPFAEIGIRLGVAPDEVIGRLRNLKTVGIIREISPVIDGRRIGYELTLIAMKVARQELEMVEEAIRRHPGVSHGYERDHDFNVWFTLSLPGGTNLDSELNALTSGFTVEAAFALPATKVFKIGAYFDIGGDGHGDSGPSANPGGALPEEAKLSRDDRAVLREIQQNLPLVATPFSGMSSRLGIDDEVLLARCRALMDAGVMRRYGASVNHRKAGFEGNGMTCWAVPESRVDSVGGKLASFPEVSHCYERKTNSLWRYNIFAMIHGRTPDACRQTAERASLEIGFHDSELLFSTREFKKERVKYLV